MVAAAADGPRGRSSVPDGFYCKFSALVRARVRNTDALVDRPVSGVRVSAHVIQYNTVMRRVYAMMYGTPLFPCKRTFSSLFIPLAPPPPKQL